MYIQANKMPQSLLPSPGVRLSTPSGPVDQSAPARINESLDFLSKIEAYARQPLLPTPLDVPALRSAPPSADLWPSNEEIEGVLQEAVSNVPEKVRTGAAALNFDNETRRDITEIQTRQAKNAKEPTLERMVHRRQLHGGAAEIHWNPNMDKFVNLFGAESRQALIRFSDASNEANPDGPGMYGMAMEMIGNGGQATDILLTGGSAKTEVSQATNAEAQLALFNMINIPNKLKGLGHIARELGPCSGVKMIRDVTKMRAELASLTDLTAWSRSPFALTGKDGKEYLVKMRAKPIEARATQPTAGTTTSDKLSSEFKNQLKQGEVRWSLDFQFMQPGDDPYDARESWDGPWLTAAVIVVPQITDEKEAARQSNLADNTKFSVWKNKGETSDSEDKDVLRPWGEMNRARQAAYGASGGNRKCPFGYG